MVKQLTLACGSYDRTAALADRRVRAEGIDLTVLTLPVEEIFFRTAKYREFPVSEMSLSSYLLTLDRDAPFIAIPVFPSRSFRHNGVYVRTDGPISSAADLVGATVGIPEYQVTAAVWIRGILADLHGVPVRSVAYRTGGLYDTRRVEKLSIDPPGIDLKPVEKDATLGELLIDGTLDAIYSPRVPPEFAAGDPRIRRLWIDSKAAEVEYFEATGIFPMMHTVVIRRDVYEADRWIARSLMKAFEAAKRVAEAQLGETAALSSMLPWSYQEAQQTRALMGQEFWTYGLDENRVALETLLRYSADQGLASGARDISELFAPETASAFVI
ncbi:ABC transporter substrate-binding protein [Leifsonia lichenia]